MSTFTATVELPPEPAAGRRARRIVAELLEAWRFAPDRRPDVMILVTEIVANAVDHARAQPGGDSVLALDLTGSDTWLCIGLADGSTIRPLVRELDTSAPRGRGMQLVAAFADRWDAHDHHGGKRVWFEIGTSPSE